MLQHATESVAAEIMAQFADRTGISSARAPRRYLWTDAFAACNLLGLYSQTDTEEYRDLAVQLIGQVHHVLGRHREDDPRSGWISGLDEEAGRQHPTRGGLRIGKQLDERRRGEPYDAHLEWDRDGQYYHYLTKWMHALNQAAGVTGDEIYRLWAVELAKAAHAGFTYQPTSRGPKRMYWKMSIDLSYPLVPSMGHHDPLDGLLTYQELQLPSPQGRKGPAWPDLSREVAEMEAMCRGERWATDDALGIGGLLSDAYLAAQLVLRGDRPLNDLLQTLLDASVQSLDTYARRDAQRLGIAYRLPFREFGLSIGLHGVERLRDLVEEHPPIFGGQRALAPLISALMKHVPLAAEIERFWLEPAHQETGSWTAHQDINAVMLATSLAPGGYLDLRE